MQGRLIIVAVISFLFVSSVNTFAQKNLPKYENVYKEAMAANNADVAYTLFTSYIEQVPDGKRANPYFQAGILAYEKAKTVHPIYDFDQFVLLRDKSETYLRLSMEYINEEDVKKDNSMYQGVVPPDKKPTYGDVYGYIHKRLDTNRIENRKVMNVYEAFTAMNTHYAKCQQLYKNISGRFASVKDMYFTFDSDLNTSLEDMIESYDSAKHYLAEYTKLIENSNIPDFHGNYEELEIATYRLDGFSLLNFTNKQTVFWDYKSWAAQLLENSGKFAAIYQEISDLNEDLSVRINSFNTNRNLSDNYLAMEVDNQLLDSLRIFGYYPALNRLVNYKEAKLNYLTQSRRRINTPAAESNEEKIMAKLQFYSNLFDQYNGVNKIFRSLSEYYKTDELAYQSANFANQNEFAEYLDEEKLENTAEYNFSIDNLNRFNVNLNNLIRDSSLIITRQKVNYPLYLGKGFYRSPSKGIITKCLTRSESGKSFYISGSSISSDGFAVAYVALCTDEKTISWVKTIDIGRVMYDNSAVSVSPTSDGGCYVLVVAKNVSDPQLITNTLIRFDAKGVEKKRFLLPEKTLGLGRYIEYIERNNRLLLSFYGENEMWYNREGKLIVQELDGDFNQVFRAELPKFNGEITHMLEVDNNEILLLGNYISLTDDKGVEHKSKARKTADSVQHSVMFSVLLGADGKIKKINHYTPNESAYVMTAKKTGINTIALIGQKGPARIDYTTPYKDNAEPIFLTVDFEGEVIRKNEKLLSNAVL